MCVCLGAFTSVCLGLEAFHSQSCRGLFFAEYKHRLSRAVSADFNCCQLMLKHNNICLDVAMVTTAHIILHLISESPFSISISDDTVRCSVT